MIRLLLLLALMCENVNAAPQAQVNAGDGIDASSQASSKPTVAAPFTLAHPLCQTGFTIAMRYDERNAAGAIIKSVWVRKCAKAPKVVYR